MDTTTTRVARFTRLEDALRAAGVADTTTSVHENVNGTLVRIVIGAARGTVEVRDHRDRADRWVGFTVWAEDRDGITLQEWNGGRRAAAVQHVREALDLLGGVK